MRVKGSLMWVVLLLVALFLGPFIVKERADLSIKSLHPLRDAVDREHLRDSVAPESTSTDSLRTIPPWSLDTR